MNWIAFFGTILSASFLFSHEALAQPCPVCMVAVTAGVGLSRWLGIDDTITGLWIGGLTLSLILWTISFLEARKIKFTGRKIIVSLSYYLFIIVPLYLTGIMGHPFNRFWGVDKLLLGMIFGSVFFFLGFLSYGFLKKKNNNKPYFPYQKIVMPITLLLILSFLFYFLTKG
ncbi:hypothetical protein FJZ40_00540 [Candidatus Shapirobacteria bacterium]|nr:hypothetical protein [Candidatus Shapirobacteria bacterium]